MCFILDQGRREKDIHKYMPLSWDHKQPEQISTPEDFEAIKSFITNLNLPELNG